MQREDLIQSMFAPPDAPPVRWRIAPSLVDYPEAVETMEREAAAIADGTADELVWLVEHPPLYTAGTSANAADLVMPDLLRFSQQEEAASTPITVPGSGSSTSCST